MHKLTNKIWMIIFAATVIASAVIIIVFNLLPGGKVAVISKNGESLYKIDLSSVTESYTIDLDGNVIFVENGYISMKSADCPDKLCIKQGKISEIGSIVCLPNKVIIEIDRSGEVDAVLRQVKIFESEATDDRCTFNSVGTDNFYNRGTNTACCPDTGN